MDIVELIRYNHAARRRYFQALANLPWDEVVRPRGASFDSMRNVFLHLTFMESRMIHYVIPGMTKDWVQPPFDDFKDMESMKRLMEDVEVRSEAYLKKLTPKKLSRDVVLPWRRDPPMTASVENILTMVALEDIHHYGELIALLWQAGEEAPYLSWLQYLAERT